MLARRVKPFLLRRTKDQVAAELPPKQESSAHRARRAQRDLYESVRLSMRQGPRGDRAGGSPAATSSILEALLKLRQVCCDPRLVKSRGAQSPPAPSSSLMEMRPADRGRAGRSSCSRNSRSMLDLIEAADDGRHPLRQLDRQTARSRRARSGFQEGRCRFS